MDDDNPHWIVPVELVTFQQVKLKQPNWLRKLQKKTCLLIGGVCLAQVQASYLGFLARLLW